MLNASILIKDGDFVKCSTEMSYLCWIAFDLQFLFLRNQFPNFLTSASDFTPQL